MMLFAPAFDKNHNIKRNSQIGAFLFKPIKLTPHKIAKGYGIKCEKVTQL